MRILHGADLNNSQVKNVAGPTEDADAATKEYVDDKVDAAVIEGGGFVLDSYEQVSDLDDYPTSFPTTSDQITDATAVGKGMVKAENQSAARTALGLSQVQNTADADKPISAQTQAALDLKANLESPTFTGTVSGISKSAVGLGNVNNTSDADKPVSDATQDALDLKAALDYVEELESRLSAIEATGAQGFLVISNTDDIPVGTPSRTPIIRVTDDFEPEPEGIKFYLGEGNQTYGHNDGSTFNYPMSAPSNTAIGDLLICYVAKQGDTNREIVVPDGWTVYNKVAGSRLFAVAVYPVTNATTLNAVTQNTQVFSTPGNAAVNRVALTMLRVSNVDLNDPVPYVGEGFQGTSTNTQYVPQEIPASSALIVGVSTTNVSAGFPSVQPFLSAGVYDAGRYDYQATTGAKTGIFAVYTSTKNLSTSPDFGIDYDPGASAATSGMVFTLKKA